MSLQSTLKKAGTAGIVAFLYFPTGTPEDLLSFWLMDKLGSLYVPIGIIILIAVWIKTR